MVHQHGRQVVLGCCLGGKLWLRAEDCGHFPHRSLLGLSGLSPKRDEVEDGNFLESGSSLPPYSIGQAAAEPRFKRSRHAPQFLIEKFHPNS